MEKNKSESFSLTNTKYQNVKAKIIKLMEKHKRISVKSKGKNELNKENMQIICQTRNFLIMSKLRISVKQR